MLSAVRQTVREQRELRAAAPSFGNRAGAGKPRRAIFAHTQRAGRDRAPLMLREKQTRVRTIGVDAGDAEDELAELRVLAPSGRRGRRPQYVLALVDDPTSMPGLPAIAGASSAIDRYNTLVNSNG